MAKVKSLGTDMPEPVLSQEAGLNLVVFFPSLIIAFIVGAFAACMGLCNSLSFWHGLWTWGAWVLLCLVVGEIVIFFLKLANLHSISLAMGIILGFCTGYGLANCIFALTNLAYTLIPSLI
jgi:hypothetical protein